MASHTFWPLCISLNHAYTGITSYTGWVKKVAAPTFSDIFAWAESFCIEFCAFIGTLYSRMSADFRLFILTFNKMALILSHTPITFTVSSLDCSAGNKNPEYQLNRNDIIGQWCWLDCRLSQQSLISTLFDQGNWRWWLLHQAPAPETFQCAVYRHKTTFPLEWTITSKTS